MSSETNPTFDLVSKKIQHMNGDVPQSDIEGLYDFVRSQPKGEEILNLMLTVPKPLTPTGTFNVNSDFRNQTGANGSLVNLWVWARVQVKADSLRRSCTTDFGGLCPGFPGGALFGTLFYNDENDLSGNCDVVMGGVTAYIYVTFYRNGNQIASFHAGNVGFNGPCVMAGSTTWSKH